MNATTKTVVGVDTAKQVFQLHWVDAETGEMFSKQLKRVKFLGKRPAPPPVQPVQR